MTKESDGEDVEVVNNVLEDLGIGKYQMITYFFIMVPTVLNIMSNNTYVFTSRDTSYRCLIANCDSDPVSFEQPWLTAALPFKDGEPDKCRRYRDRRDTETFDEHVNGTCNLEVFDNRTTHQCSEWVFGEGDTIVKEFNIPCEDWKRSLVPTLNSAGLMVNMLYSGFLSDKYGRRNTMVLLMFVGGLTGCLQSFSLNYVMFCILEFLNLAIGAGSYSISYVLVAETLPPSKRIYGCALIETINSLSIAFVGYIAWITPTWKHLLRYINFPLLASPLIVFVVPESLRWLHAKGHTQKCIELYKKSAKVNGTVVSDNNVLELVEFSEKLINQKSIDENNESTCLAMFKSSRLMGRLLLSSFCWFSSILAYDGLSINSVNIAKSEDNAFLDFILVTLIELPSILLYLIILRFLNRRVGLSISFIGAGIFCIVYGAFDNLNETLRFCIYLAGKMFINTSLASMYVYSSEIFPTVLRSSSMNFCYVFGSIGGIISPQILLLNKYDKSYPMYIYGIISILSSLAILSLPETKGRKIPDTLKDAEDL